MIATDPLGKEFLGRGWAFPFRLTAGSGEVARVEHEEDIREAILIILGTSKGERVMRPDFGCAIHERVFATVNSATTTQIRRDVSDALRTYEPRIELLSVTVDFAPLYEGRLDVRIDYRVRSTNQSDNLVYPFYYREAR